MNLPALPIVPKVSGQGVVYKKDGTASVAWVSCAERFPGRNEAPDGYFWGWDESKPDNAPGLYEAWERDGIPQGFCHEAVGLCPWVTHWMPAIPPAPPTK